MTIDIFALKGDLHGENRSGAFLFLSGILVLNQVRLSQRKYATTGRNTFEKKKGLQLCQNGRTVHV